MDILLGPGSLLDIGKSLEGNERFWALQFRDDLHAHVPPPPQGTLQAHLTIMRGCDHHCTYCIVPTTRGPQVSRSPDDILLLSGSTQRTYTMTVARGNWGGTGNVYSYEAVKQLNIDRQDWKDLTSGETVVCAYADFPNHFGFFLPLAGISTVKQLRDSSFRRASTRSSGWRCMAASTRSGTCVGPGAWRNSWPTILGAGR